MKAKYKNRLLKLAAHLEKGKLGHKKFNFRTWNADSGGKQIFENGCGFSGCAIGECPIVFPRQWRFFEGFPSTLEGISRIRAGAAVKTYVPASSGKEFFGLCDHEFSHLFVPACILAGDEGFGGQRLPARATRRQVAKNIRAFVAYKQKEAAV